MSERAVEELLSDVSWAIAQRLPKRDLFAMLTRLVASAQPGSAEERFAKLELARLALDKQPFRAARLAQEALRHGADETALGLLGVAHMRLGHFRAARRAFEKALRKGDCPNPDELVQAADVVDDAVPDVLEILDPPPPVCCLLSASCNAAAVCS